MRARTLLLFVLLARSAAADPRTEALEEFKIGVAHFSRRDFPAALASFRRSRALFPTKGAAGNIATCLRELGRFDEAFDALAELGDDTSQIAAYTAFVRVRSETPGAKIIIDGRDRGATPLEQPIRVSVGTRRVRVEKEGHSPFETTIIVASGETSDVSARLAVVAQLGRLRVLETSGRSLDVRLDGVAVGRTPWEGDVSTGEHTVALVGEHDIGAAPRAVRVELGRTRDVTITAGVLSSDLRVETTPTNAQVKLDGAFVSVGTWTGAPPSGAHAVDITSPWYQSKHLDLALSSREPRVVRVELEPIRRVYVELYGGPTAFSAYNTPGLPSCATCVGYMLGIRGGFLLDRHVGLEIFLVPAMDVHRSDPRWNASLALSYGGGSVKLALFDKTPLTLRAIGGLALGGAYGGRFWTPIGGPEARFGYRIARTVVVDVGAALLFFMTPQTGFVLASDDSVGRLIDSGVGITLPITLGLHADL